MEIAATPLARKLAQYVALGPEELRCVGRLLGRSRPIGRHVDLLYEGAPNQQCFILLEGWACCYKLLPDGRRQIVNVALPGDFVGLRNLLMRSADESVASITPVQVSAVSKSELFRIIDEMPRVGTAVLWALSCEEAVVAEHVVSLGRRDALERISHFLLELRERLQVVGLASERGYSCPLVQHDLADTLGLTVIHVNRILRRLRERELLTLSRGRLRIHDLRRLTELAKFTGRYLDHASEHSVQ